MDIIYILVPLSIVLIGIATLIFFWAVRSGQFDDMDSPAHKILFDDDDSLPSSNKQPPLKPLPETPSTASPEPSSKATTATNSDTPHSSS